MADFTHRNQASMKSTYPANKKIKVAVLGGGLGALSSIYEMTTLPENRDKYEITVYQMGWRLGGKGASGRNLSKSNRIEEHGLHVWFGFYDNAFRIMRDVYQELNRHPNTPYATLEDTFKPRDFVVFMEQYKDTWVPWPITFPTNSQIPGAGDALPSFWSMVQMSLGWLIHNFEMLVLENPRLFFAASMVRPTDRRDGWSKRVRHVIASAEKRFQLNDQTRLMDLLYAAQRLTDSVLQDRFHIMADASLEPLCWLINQFRAWLWRIVESQLDNHQIRQFWILVDTGITWFVGIVKDKIIEKGFFSIDDYDFREWMLKHGAKAEPTVNSGPPVRGIYDAAFAYENGNVDTPNFAAGSALLGALRIVFTYKGHVLYEMQAGMGDVVITPFYQVLKNRGVKFKFFHSVQDLKLSPDKTAIQSIEIMPQVELLVDDYDPMVLVKDLPSWPSEPLWWQLKNGEALRTQGINFDHTVSVNPEQMPIMLERGQDFDMVILGIPIKATEAISQSLYANPKTPQWKAMIDHVKTVQTQAYQVWLNQDLTGLGWIKEDNVPVLGTYVELLDTYADMSHLIAQESWRTDLNVRHIAYFCGAQPDTTTQDEADSQAYQAAYDHTVNNMPLLWQNLKTPKGQMQWDFFVDPQHGAGEDRFKAQFFRANWSPSERYTLSVKGSTKYRLKADATGYNNLFICGDWTDNNLNSGCIEATIMSGMQCSQAICGYPAAIIGDDITKWLRRP